MKLRTVLVSLLTLFTMTMSADNQEFTNPVVDADYPDVDIIRVGPDYYMLSTTMYHFPGATILHSRDMVNWYFCAQPLKRIPNRPAYDLTNGQSEYAHGMWASGLKYHDGMFYLLLNVQGSGSYIMTAKDLQGEWTIKKLDHTYYDSNFLFDNDGRIYIIYGNSQISIAEVDKDFNYIRSKEVVNRPHSGLEGNHLYHIGDYYYIYDTYGGYPSGQAAFRSKDVFGDYEEKMLFEKRIGGRINTVHQGALVQTPTGEWWSLLFEDEGFSGRQPHLQPVTWVDGWPLLGNNGVPLTKCHYPSTGFYPDTPNPCADKTKATEASDDFDDAELSLQWQWNHHEVPGAWSLQARPGWLRLNTVGKVDRLKYARNTLTERLPGFKKHGDNTATIRIDVSHMKKGDKAGLSVFQDPYSGIGIECLGKGYNLFWQRDTVKAQTKAEPAEEKTAVKLTDGIVYLRAKVNFPSSSASYEYSVDGTHFVPFGKTTQMWFNLTTFVGARFYLFNYATKKTGGYVDFDYLHFQ